MHLCWVQNKIGHWYNRLLFLDVWQQEGLSIIWNTFTDQANDSLEKFPQS